MTKADLAKKIGDDLNVPTDEAVKFVEAYNKAVIESLQAGKTIYMRGFGTFLLKQVKGKVARNISTGASVIVPSRKKFTFRPSKKVKFM